MGGLCKAATMADDEISEEALKALIEIPEISYDFIGEYIPEVGKITQNLMASNKEQFA